MGLSTAGNLKSKPLYYHLYDSGVIEKLEFSLWFGHNGGRFIVGGFDDELVLEPEQEIQYTKLKDGDQFKISLSAFKVGNIVLPSSPKSGFVDSGTTFAYMSKVQLAQIDRALTQLCDSKQYNCLGERLKENWYAPSLTPIQFQIPPISNPLPERLLPFLPNLANRDWGRRGDQVVPQWVLLQS